MNKAQILYDQRRRDAMFCRACDREIHERIHCEICGADGCRCCLIQDPETGERRCEENCYEHALERAAKKAATSGSRADLREYLRLERRKAHERQVTHAD